MTETEKKLRAEVSKLRRENVRLFTLLHGRPPRSVELDWDMTLINPCEKEVAL